MNNKWLILLDSSLQLCRAGSYFMWKTLLMKAFQPLASPSNNILDLPCQQTCLETWLPSQTWQKHHQVQKTNWWASGKGPPEEGAFLWCSTVKENSLGERTGGFLLCLFIMIKIFLFLTEANIEMEEKAAHCSAGSDHDISACRFSPWADTQPPPTSRAYSLWVTVAEGWWCLPWRYSHEHQPAQMRNPKAAGSEAWLAEPPPKEALFPPAQTGASRWQGWQLQLDPSLDSSLFSLPVTLLLSFSPINTHMLYSWSCIQTRGKPPKPGIRKGGREAWSLPIFRVLKPVTATWLYLGVAEGGSFKDKKTARL